MGPTVIASDSKGFSDPTAAYTTDGRMWITWAEPRSAVLLAKLGDATGAGGSPIRALTPSGYSTALNTAATIRGPNSCSLPTGNGPRHPRHRSVRHRHQRPPLGANHPSPEVRDASMMNPAMPAARSHGRLIRRGYRRS